MTKIAISLLPSGSAALGQNPCRPLGHVGRFVIYPAKVSDGLGFRSPPPLGHEHLSRPGHMFSAALSDGKRVDVSPSIWASPKGEHVVVLACKNATRMQIIEAARMALLCREEQPLPA
jgi:hypothetical protein